MAWGHFQIAKLDETGVVIAASAEACLFVEKMRSVLKPVLKDPCAVSANLNARSSVTAMAVPSLPASGPSRGTHVHCCRALRPMPRLPALDTLGILFILAKAVRAR